MSLGRWLTLALLVLGSTVAFGDDPKKKDDGIDWVWLPESAEMAGQKFPDEVRKALRLEVKGDQYTAFVGMNPDRGTCKLDPSAKPKALDIIGTDGPNKGKTLRGIYKFDGDKLIYCIAGSGLERPKEFASPEGSKLRLYTNKRVK